ncbi:class I SAM-dependent methyltransferase [Clostridium botulinum]|uniref:Class I SAM-dependent methyltransferase n=1 Tax=Clostridium botulinum TaxID=1491 RepID=A0A846JD12_CLOBO|nr:class I SAM-dependent methyltransferase [Clostridium botulinum]ACA56663.1 methyltransferase [Clostridium botulinum A3 str. Loch Maree]NFH65477.1 class I SAM-dependent methyltransferase [Clostridium botulinum]NFJ09753.1 class I SAM-dependent methyltransferase [Clostridium botulinum]NFK14733.1 class I SAM-dependent methyltransferase [Clostridium botulinum]NFM94281.1 class I SAM-dependent methyltransferase [Clostridium botulinum]
MDIISHNSNAWDRKVENGSIWSKAVSTEIIEKAKKGEWEISVTAQKSIPKNWFPPLEGLVILCLASGGGQQGQILAAAGADVTVVDISQKQLEQDIYVAKRDNLKINTLKCSMLELSMFSDESFDLIIHPVSNLFVENILPVWKEAFRILKYGGILISGFCNPVLYLFDDEQENEGVFQIKYSIPYSSLSTLSEEELNKLLEEEQVLEFGHSLEQQIGGQIEAGFMITGFYEDDFGGERLLDKYIKSFIATKAMKIKI